MTTATKSSPVTPQSPGVFTVAVVYALGDEGAGREVR